MKVVMYMDRFLYQKLYMNFPKYDESGDPVGSLFSNEEYDNYWIQDKQYLNLALNPLDGIRDIYIYLIQKSWYKDSVCINICKFIKQLHPEANIIFFMDKENENHAWFCHRLASENLGFVAHDMNELMDILSSNFSLEQDQYRLDHIKKRERKRLEKLFAMS